jgi:hypothetical protein
MVQLSEAMAARESSSLGRGQKQANTGLLLPIADKENESLRGVRY